MRRRKRNVVYSTDSAFEKRCERCGSYPCRCPKPKSAPPHEQTIYLHHESKGRGGKKVVVLKELQLTEADMKKLAKQLKKACGVGGAVKDGEIVIQGDVRDRIAEELGKLGYQTKLAGG